MQYRMKTHRLDTAQINDLLSTAQTGCIATVNPDGTPYVTPIHFIYDNGAIYFHGLPKGQKIDNLKTNPCVSFNVYHQDSFLLDPAGKPCDTNTKYESVVISGKARLLKDLERKNNILTLIVQKYTPHLSHVPLPENMVQGTAVVEIEILDLTGKYYE